MNIFNKIKNKIKNNYKNVIDTSAIDNELLKALINNEVIDRDKAMMLPQVASDVDLICELIAMIPFKLYKKTIKDGRYTVEEMNDYRVNILNNKTGDSLDGFQWKKAIAEDYLLGKGGYAYIQRIRNKIISIHYVEDKYVSYLKSTDHIFKYNQFCIDGKTYEYYDLIKILRNTKNGAYGVGVTDQVSKAIETAYNMLVYQLGLVKTGGNKKGFLKSTNRLDKDQMDKLKSAWKQLYANNENNIMILNDGLSFQESSNNSVELQLYQNNIGLNNSIDKIFHIEKTFDETFKNAIAPILKAIEAQLNDVFLLENEKEIYFWGCDTKDAIKGNLKDRYEAYKTAKDAGIMTINEIRKEENKNAIPGMDVLQISQGNVLYDIDKKEFYSPNRGSTEKIDSNNNNDINNKSKGGVSNE